LFTLLSLHNKKNLFVSDVISQCTETTAKPQNESVIRFAPSETHKFPEARQMQLGNDVQKKRNTVTTASLTVGVHFVLT
jgi:hypothetical protein